MELLRTPIAVTTEDDSKSEVQINNTKWDYIACFVIEVYENNYEILNYNFISLRGDMDSECYFSECVSNAEAKDFLSTDYTGKIVEEMTPGSYQLVYGCNARGDSYWTDCGMEYDAWEDYELLSIYKFTKKEEKFIDEPTDHYDDDMRLNDY